MARSHVNHFSEFPYHITGRNSNREAFRSDISEVWEILCEQLFLAHHIYGLRIHSFVLMPNHFHLIAKVTGCSLPQVMAHFMRESSKEFNLRTHRINQNWGGRHFKCELTNYHYFMNTYKYVYQNPVRAGLATQVEGWRYSTLHGLLGLSILPFPMAEDTLLFNEKNLEESTLQWLNQPIQDDDLKRMRIALIKKKFKASSSHSNTKNNIEDNLI